MLSLITLGGLSVRRDGIPVDTSRIRKPLAMLAVVAAAGDAGVSRERLQGLFWPESDADRARGGLKQAQYVIRQSLGIDPFRPGGFVVALEPATISADAPEFEARVRRGELDAAVALYAGPFLDGVYLKDVPDFEQWVDRERMRLAALYGRTLEGLATAAMARHDVISAASWWRRRAEIDRIDARVARKYIEALGAAGDREAAIRYARVHAELVRAELGEQPDLSLIALAESLRSASAERRNEVAQHADRAAEVVVGGDPALAPSVAVVATTERQWTRRVSWFSAVAAVAVLFVGLFARRHASDAAPVRPAAQVTAASPVADVVAPGITSVSSVSPQGAPDPPRNIGRVLVTPLSNESRDTSAATFGRLAADWMATALAQTGMVDVVDAQTLAGMAQLRVAQGDMIDSSGAALRPLTAATHAKTVVVGRYYTTRESLVVQVMIEDAADGQVLRTLPRLAVRAGDYNKALALLRDRIAGAFATLVDPRIESLVDRATPAPSLSAYRHYAEGLDCYIRNPGGLATGTEACSSAASFEAAIRADSSWSLPYVWLLYSNLSKGAVVDSLLAIVARRRDHQSELERRGFEFFERRRKGDLEGALAAARRASILAPRSNWTYQAAQTAQQLSRWRESRDLLHQLDPEHGWIRGWSAYWLVLGMDEHMLGNYRAELAFSPRRDASQPESSLLLDLRLGALIALGDSALVLRTIDSAIANPPSGNPSINRLTPLLNELQNEAAAHGHPQLSRQIADRCLAETNPPALTTPEQRRAMHIHAACLYAEGRWSETRTALDHLMEAAPSDVRNVDNAERVLLLVETHMGDSIGAAAHMSQILSRSDLSTRVADSIMMLAHMAAIKGLKERTVELLRQMPIAANRYPTILHLNPDFRGLLTYPPFKALMAPRG